MLKGISWKTYLTVGLSVTLIFYAAIIIIYFKKEIIHFIRNGFKQDKKPVTHFNSESASSETELINSPIERSAGDPSAMK